MKRKFFLIIVAIIFGVTGTSHATLIDQGGGLIYDTDLNITWYAVVNNTEMTWGEANSWAASLTLGGVSGWRLPESDLTCSGHNCTGSEMGHLYYDELGYVAGGQLTNVGPFTNLQLSYYWFNPPIITHAFGHVFYALDEYEAYDNNSSHRYGALAVHEGDVAPVPEPSTMLFLASALIGLTGLGRKFKK